MAVAVVALAFAVAAALFILTTGAKIRGAVRSARSLSPHVASLDELGQRTATFIGGATGPGGGATAPLVRLDLHERGLRLHGARRFLDHVVPSWSATYANILDASHIRGARPLRDSGLFVQVPGSTGWIIFWYDGDLGAILNELGEHGVTLSASRDRTRLRPSE